jgi:hypothetical protein
MSQQLCHWRQFVEPSPCLAIELFGLARVACLVQFTRSNIYWKSEILSIVSALAQDMYLPIGRF